MTAKNYYEDVKHVVHVSTGIDTGCEHCVKEIGSEGFAKSVNHYIDKHSYKLLHVGSETVHDDTGKPWHTTVAILGK